MWLHVKYSERFVNMVSYSYKLVVLFPFFFDATTVASGCQLFVKCCKKPFAPGMASFDYVSLGGTPGHRTWGLRSIPAVVGVFLCATTGFLSTLRHKYLPGVSTSLQRTHSNKPWAMFLSGKEGEGRPAQPAEGINAVLVKPGYPSLAQWGVPPSANGPYCLFLYEPSGLDDKYFFDSAETSRTGWVYGATVRAGDRFATVTGKPGDILPGNLLCFPPSTFEKVMKRRELDLDRNQCLRGEVAVVTPNGEANAAYWHHLVGWNEPWPRLVLRRFGIACISPFRANITA
eukprot:g49329.t1